MRDKRMDSRATAQHELLLIRIGHHLWNWRKQALKHHDWPLADEYLKCCQVVWALKEEIRVPLRAEHLKARETRETRLKNHRFGVKSNA